MMHVSELMKKHQLSDIKASDANGDTILHLVIKDEELMIYEKITVIDSLLKNAVDPNIKNKNGETVLHLAIASRAKNLIDFLLRLQVHIDDSIAEYLVKDENEKFNKVLDTDFKVLDNDMEKMENESVNFIEWTMSKRLLNVDFVTSDGQNALTLTMNFNLHHLLPTLLKYTTNINYVDPKTKSSLLHLFLESNAILRSQHNTRATNFYQENRKRLYPGYIKRNAEDIVKIMLEKGILLESVNETGNTALHVAITKQENTRIIQMLINNSNDVNCKNLEGETPFHISIRKWVESKNLQVDDKVIILRSLIAKGANVNEPNKSGNSPLCTAIQAHNLAAVKFLKENGANFNVITEEGETLLHLLTKKYNYITKDNEKIIELFDMLISHGCNINARDITGKTALHMAAQNCDVLLAQKLIEHGAQINCKNNLGETPLCFYVYVHVPQNNFANNNQIRNEPIRRDHEADDLDTLALVEALAILATHMRNHFGSIRNHTNPYIKMLELLLKNGADFDRKFHNGLSILHMALWQHFHFYRSNDKDFIAPENLPSLTECLSNEIGDKVKRLLSHWIKLEVVNLKCYTGFEYTDLMKEEEYKKIDQKCRSEIKILKDTFIDSRTTLYTLLHMDLNSRRAYINNEKLKNILQSPKFEEEYPEYSVLIFSSYKEALTRKSLMEPGKKTWLKLTEIQLPEVCIELIFSYLSNAELFDFIEGI